jgi:hypothetical protein
MFAEGRGFGKSLGIRVSKFCPIYFEAAIFVYWADGCKMGNASFDFIDG